MSIPASTPSAGSTRYRWALRVLLLSLAGICLLTLYPFHLEAHRHPATASPFFLQGSEKAADRLDDLLNVLLFVPYGFGLAGLLRKRGVSRLKVAVLALIAGAILSYSVEFIQFFIPPRDSGWGDVVTNSSGSLIGGLILLAVGAPLLGVVQWLEAVIEKRGSAAVFSFLLLAYLGFWFALAARMQSQATIRVWNPNSYLEVGASGYRWSPEAWKGEISRLQFWDHPVSEAIAASLASGAQPSPQDGAIADYDFAAPPPFHDLGGAAPDLIWTARPRAVPGSSWDGKSWLITQTPASSSVQKIMAAGQFAVRIRFTPALVDGAEGRLVSIAAPGDSSYLEIQQKSESLAFWFRTKFNSPYSLTWTIPKILSPGQRRDFLFSYDGARLSAFENGRPIYSGYRLGPGAALAASLRLSKTAELQGYRYAFYGLLFFPAGILLGLARRGARRSRIVSMALSGAAVVLPPLALELLLTRVGGQPLSVGDIFLGILMSVCGWLWINAEGPVRQTVRKGSAVIRPAESDR